MTDWVSARRNPPAVQACPICAAVLGAGVTGVPGHHGNVASARIPGRGGQKGSGDLMACLECSYQDIHVPMCSPCVFILTCRVWIYILQCK